jgi:enamine deaminase RidA (YjgF/YER057c/UK114 family)
VSAGKIVHVSCTAATYSQATLVGIEDAESQTIQARTNVKNVLESIGAKLEDVARTRIYVTDIEQWEETGRVHGKSFGDVRPTTTIIKVKRLISPEMLVEIEVEAIWN